MEKSKAEEKEALARKDSSQSRKSAVSRASTVSTSIRLANVSCWAKIAYSPIFINVTLAVIVLNAIWIGIDVEWNHPNRKKVQQIRYDGSSVWLEDVKQGKLPLEPGSTIVENVFCTYFSVELLIRFLAFKHTSYICQDRWFMFDSVLVAFMVIETWILVIVDAIMDSGEGGMLSKFSALRLLRLLRLTRVTRLVREVPELLTLLKGMISAARAVSFILLFLLLCMYVFAIVFTAQLGDHEAPEHKEELPYWERDDGDGHDPTGIELFGSLGDSMMTLFTRGMLGDNLAETLEAIKDRGGELECPSEDATLGDCARTGGSLFLFWVFITFMIISAFCLLNMLIGVLCEVIAESSNREKETAELTSLRRNLQAAFDQIDSGGVKDGLITQIEFANMRHSKLVQRSMAALGVEDEHIQERLDQIQDSLFGRGDEDSLFEAHDSERRDGLTFEELMSKVVDIRPDTPASALDMEILRARVEQDEKAFSQSLDAVEAMVDKTLAGDLPNLKETDNGRIPPWLREVPTEVLFNVLHSRPPSESSPQKILDNR